MFVCVRVFLAALDLQSLDPETSFKNLRVEWEAARPAVMAFLNGTAPAAEEDSLESPTHSIGDKRSLVSERVAIIDAVSDGVSGSLSFSQPRKFVCVVDVQVACHSVLRVCPSPALQLLASNNYEDVDVGWAGFRIVTSEIGLSRAP